MGASKVARILIVDDDPETQILLVEILGEEYHLVLAGCAQKALDTLRKERFHLALVDVRLPEMSGLDLLPRMRALDPQLGVILITAYGEVSDAVRSLRDLKALDYVEKPFSPQELRQRVSRALRLLDGRRKVALGDLVLDCETWQVSRDGELLFLSRQGFDLLLYLACRKERAVSHEELIRKVWGCEPSPAGEQSVRRAISRLRRGLRDGAGGRSYIETVWGIGYQAQD